MSLLLATVLSHGGGAPLVGGVFLLLGYDKLRALAQRKGRHILLKTLALGLGSFTSFWGHAPEHVLMGAIGASLMIGVDTIIGIACACVFREFRSRRLRERLIAKFLYYAAFIGVSYILGALLRAYWMLAASWYAVVLIELASVMETLTRLHVRGGKRFGPAETILQAFARAMGEAAKSTLPNGETPEKEKDGDA